MQARLESSLWGRALLSLLVAAIVGAIVVINLPDSQLRQDADRFAKPLVDVTGLDQNWGIFADPRTTSAYVEARVDFADGSTSLVNIPHSSGLFAYADYRWQKYEEIIRPDDGSSYWPAYASYIAANARKGGRKPVTVSLIRRFAATRPPGPGPERNPWTSFTFYVLRVSATT